MSRRGAPCPYGLATLKDGVKPPRHAYPKSTKIFLLTEIIKKETKKLPLR